MRLYAFRFAAYLSIVAWLASQAALPILATSIPATRHSQAPIAPAPHPILSDVQVRKAIAFCTDKDALIASVYPGLTALGRQALVMDTFIPNTNWAYSAPTTTYSYAPATGRSLLDAAGWTLPLGADYRTKNGKTLALRLTTTTASFRATYLAVFQAQMKACGIQVILNPQPAGWWFGANTGLSARDFELGDFAWVAGADPAGRTLYACDQIPLPTNGWSGQNYMGWCNSAASDAITLADNPQLAQNQRKAYYATVINAFAEDLPSLPLFARDGSTPDATTWEHIDFNLQTFTQAADITVAGGGLLSYTDFRGNQGAIAVPSGAVTQTVSLGYVPLVSGTNPPPTNLQFAKAFRLEASVEGVLQSGSVFSQPVTITVKYNSADLVDIFDENSLSLYYWNGASWQDASATCPLAQQYRQLDTVQKTLVVKVCHLTEFGLIGTFNTRVFLPLVTH